MKRYHEDGLPQKTKNVAFSNGALSGETTYKDKTKASSLFKMEGSFWLGATLFDLINNDQTLGSILAKFLIGPSTIEVSIEGYPVTPKATLIYRGQMAYTKKFLFLIPIDHIISKIEVRNLYPKDVKMTPDFVAGGTLDMGFSNLYKKNIFIAEGWCRFAQSEFTLVPRNSALGIPTSIWEVSRGSESIGHLQEFSPFDVIYAPLKKSLPHMNLGDEEQLGNLRYELSEPAPPRSYRPQISGPNVIVPLEESVYTISNPYTNPNPKFQKYHVWLYMGEGKKTWSMKVPNYEFWRLASDTLFINSRNLDPGKYEINLFTFNKGTNKLEEKSSYLVRVGVPDIQALTIKQDQAIPFREEFVAHQLLYLPTLSLSYSGYGDITGIEFKRCNKVRYPIVDYRYAYDPKEAVIGEMFPKNSIALLTAKSYSSQKISNRTSNLIEKQTDIISGDQHNDFNHIHIDPPEYDINIPSYLVAQFSNIEWIQTFTSLPIESRITGQDIKLTLQVRLQNQAGWSDWSKPFEYHYTGRSESSSLLIAPNVVTAFGSDAILKKAGDGATTPLPYGNQYRVSIISNSTGKLCREVSIEIGSPIGLILLPNDVYIIKVYNFSGQECGTFSAIKK